MDTGKNRGRRWLRIALLSSSGIAGISAGAIAASINANDTASLQTAILGVNAGTYDTINITGNITLTQELTAITNTVTVTGNNNTISGNNTYRILFVDAPSAQSVNISNLTLANGNAVGGAGGAGGGGGLGAGGALFAMSGQITLSNVSFLGNQAVGGAGGAGGIGFGGGGGLGGAGGTDNTENTMGGGGGVGLSATGGHAGVAAGAGILPGGSGGAGSSGTAGGANSGGGGSSGPGGGGGGLNGFPGDGTNFAGGTGGFGGGGGGGAEDASGNGGFGGGGGGGFFGTESGGNGGFGGGGGGGQNSGGGGYGGGAGQHSPEGSGGGGAAFGGTLFVCTTGIDSNCAATLTISNSGNSTIDGNVQGGSGAVSGAAQGGALFLTSGGVGNFNITGGITTITGDIAGVGDGGIVVTGAGELDLTSSASNYSGGTLVKSGGTLGIISGTSLGSGNVTLGSNGTTGTLTNADTTNFTLSKAITLVASGIGQIAGGTHGLTISGQVGGSGALKIIGGGEVDLTNSSNTFTGGVTVTGNSVLGMSAPNPQNGGPDNLNAAVVITLGDGGGKGTLRNVAGRNIFPLGQAIAIGSGGGVIDGAGHIMDLTGQVTGSAPLEIASSNGFSTVILENPANSFSGTITLDNNAQLTIGSGTTGVLNSDVLFGGGGNTLSFNLASNYTYSHNISGSSTGGLSVQGPGVITLSGDNHNATGVLNLSGGSFAITSDNNLPGGSSGTGSDNEVRFAQTGSTLYLTGTNTFAHILDLTTVGGTVSVSSGQTATWSGSIGGFSSPSLTIVGGGIFKPTSTSNSYGSTIVQGGGTLQISSGGQIGNGALLLGGGGSGTLVLGANSVLQGLSSITIGSGGGIIDSTGFSQNVSSIGDSGSGASRTLELKGGSLLLSGAGAYTGQTQIDSGATFQLGNGSAGTLASTSVVDNGTLYIDATTNPAAYSFAVSGNGDIQSLFYGAATLSGSSASFSGTLIAGANTQLSVTGNFSGASATQVMTGASLGGSGTVANVEIFGGGTLAPGDPTTTHVSGTLAFDSGSNYNVELDAGGAGDQTIVTGNISLGSGNAALNITAGGAGSIASGTIYTILSSSGGTVSGDFSNATTDGAQFLFGSGLYFATVNYLAGSVTVTVTPGENDWQGSDTEFATAGNWSLGFAPNASVGATFLNNGASTSVAVDSNVTTTGLTFASGAPAYTVSVTGFSTLDLTGAGIVDNSSNVPNLFVANSSNLIFDNSASAGDANVTVYGNLKFNGSSSGGTAIVGLHSGGALDISGATGSVAIGDLSSDDPTDIIALGAKTLIVGGLNNNDTIVGTITGAAGSVLDKVGTGTLTLSTSLAGPLNSQAATTIENGTLALYDEDSLGASNGTLTLGNGATQGTLDVTGAPFITQNVVIAAGGGKFVADGSFVINGAITGTGTMEIAPAFGLVALTGDAAPGATTIDSGATLYIGNNTATGSLSGNVANSGLLAFDRSNTTLNFAGNITGAGEVDILSTGGVTFSGTGNTYSGLTQVDGVLNAGGDNTLSASSIYKVTAGASLTLNDHNVAIGNLEGGTATTGGTVAIGTGTLTLSGTNLARFGGDITGSGTLALDSGTALGLKLTQSNDFNGAITIAADNTLYIGDGGTTGDIDAASYAVASGGKLVFNRIDSISISSSISGAGELDIDTTNLALTGDNSGFTGNTVIGAGGELDITANNQIPGAVTGGTGVLSVAANSAITYNNDIDVATLKIAGSNVFAVNGTVAGDIQDNGNLALSNNGETYSGTLTGTGTLAVNAGAGIFAMTSGSGNSFSGALDVAGGALLLSGSLPSAHATVESGAILGINAGSQLGSADVKSGGTFGVITPGTATVNGTVTLEAGSDLQFLIDDSGSAGSLSVTGNVSLAGTLDMEPNAGTYTLGQTFTVLSTSGTLGGHFSGLLQQSTIGGGLGAEIQYTGTGATVKIVDGHVWTPGTGDFNTAANWSSGSVPCSCEVAEFDASATITSITNGGSVAVDELLFDAGASAFTITTSASAGGPASFGIGAGGIVDNSGHVPTLIADGDVAHFNGATVLLADGSAGDAIFQANNAASVILFVGTADAAGASVVLTGGSLDVAGDTNSTVQVGALSGDGGSAATAGATALTLAVGGRNTNTIFDGALTGSALTLQKVGTGTLTLTNIGNQQVADIISGGGLNVNSDAALGGASVPLTLGTGGALQWGAVFDPDSSHAITLATGGGVFDTNSYDATIGSVIDGAGSLTKAGAGTLTLTASNTYSGGTHINGGTLAIADDSNLGQAGTALGIADGTLELDGSIAAISRPVTIAGDAILDNESASDVIFDQVIGGTGRLTIAGCGCAAVQFVNAETYTGGTILADGTALVLGDGNLNNGSILGDVTLGTDSALIFFDPDPTTFAGNITTASGASAPNGVQILSGVVTLTGNNDFALAAVGPGAVLNVSSEANLGNSEVGLFDGTLQFGANANFTSKISLEFDGLLDTNGHAVTWGGQIVDAVPGPNDLNIAGGGSVTLTNATNSWTGGIFVAGGSTLGAGSDGALGDASNAIDLGDATTSGTLQFTTGFALGAGRSLTLEAGGGGIDTDGNTDTVAQVIDGAGAFTKSGAGNLIISGTETYTGATIINGGILSVNGSIASSSGVIVNSGGTLGGNGIEPNVIVNAGGNLAPGNSIGTVNIAGNLTLAAGSSFTAQLSSTDSDKVIVSGTASIAGKLVLIPTGSGFSSGANYSLITAAGGLSGSFSSIEVGAGFDPTLAPKLVFGPNGIGLDVIVATFGWSALPTSSDWNTAANWVSGQVPGATNDAVFNATTAANITIGQADVTRSLVFNTGAPAYNIAITGSATGAASLTLSQGITDASGKPPTFTVSGAAGHTGALAFTGTGTAADAKLVAGNFGTVSFTDNTDAGGGAGLTVNSGGTADFSGTTGTGSTKQVTVGALAGTGGTVSLGNNSLTVGALNTSTTYAGTIADGGTAKGTGASLVKVGTGTLTLSGTNTYTGGTTVSGGTLALAGTLAGNIRDNATLAFVSSTDKTYSGLIFGSGAVVQAGTGMVTLAGTQTYTGATTVNAGTLAVTGNITKSSGVAVNTGGTLAGTGTVPGVSVASGGTIAPGIGGVGTLNVSGNLSLASGSTYALDTTPGASDLISVSANAAVGGTLAINAGSGVYSYNQQIAVLVAAGGVSGNFANSALTGSFGSNVVAQVNNSANSVYLTLLPRTITGLLPVDAPANLQGVANALNQVLATQSGQQALAPLANLTPGQLETVLSGIAGNPSAGTTTNFNLGSQFIQTLLSPFQDSRSSGSGPALSFNAPDGVLPAQLSTGDVSFWGTLYGNRFVQGADAATAAPKSDSSAGGMMAGMDYHLSDVSVVGAAAGYGTAQWNFGTGLGHSDGAQLGVFGSTRFDAIYLSGAGAVFFPTVKNSRMVNVLGSGSIYNSTYSMTGYGGRLEAGRRFDASGDMGTNLGVSPYLALVAQGASLPAYQETTAAGPATYALNYGAANINATQEELGLSLDHLIANGDNNLSLEGRAGWVHDSSGLMAQTLSLQAFANSGFTDRVQAGDRDAARFSLAARANLDGGLSVSVKGQVDAGARTQGYSGNAYLSYKW